ncbi:unnamed protein product, partial [Meganyctiphanes norvegica]
DSLSGTSSSGNETKSCSAISKTDDGIKEGTEMFVKKRAQKTHECMICSKICNSRPALSYHIATKHPSRMYDCTVCSASFTHPSLLASHELRHGERNVMCHRCGRKFFTQKQLNSHENHFHRHARSYTCDVCGSRYSKLKVLQYHRRIHDRDSETQGDMQQSTDHVLLQSKRDVSQSNEEDLSADAKDQNDTHTLEEKKMRICFNNSKAKELKNMNKASNVKSKNPHSVVGISNEYIDKNLMGRKTNIKVIQDQSSTLDRRKVKTEEISKISNMDICMELAKNEVMICEAPLDDIDGKNTVIIISSDSNDPLA